MTLRLWIIVEKLWLEKPRICPPQLHGPGTTRFQTTMKVSNPNGGLHALGEARAATGPPRETAAANHKMPVRCEIPGREA